MTSGATADPHPSHQNDDAPCEPSEPREPDAFSSEPPWQPLSPPPPCCLSDSDAESDDNIRRLMSSSNNASSGRFAYPS